MSINLTQMNRSFLFLLLLLSFYSCYHVKPEAPQRSELDSLMVVPESELNIPLNFEVSNLQDWINKKIAGNFIKKGFKVNNKKDSLYLSVEKIAPIQLKWKNGVMHFEFPLKLTGTYFKTFGNITLSNPNPLETQLTLKMNSALSIDKNWNILSQSTLQSIEWHTEPEINVGPIKINLKEALEDLVYGEEDTLTQLLDKTAYDQINFKKTIEKVWNDIQKPIVVSKENPEIYLKNRAIRLEGDLLKNTEDTIVLDLSLFSNACMTLDEKLLPTANMNLSTLQPRSDNNDEFKLSIHGQLPYEKINFELNALLKNKKIDVKGYETTLKEIEIYGSGQSLVVMIDAVGDLKGKLYALGELAYNAEKQLFSIENFRYDIDTEDQLIKTAHLFLKDEILIEVNQYLSFDVSPYLKNLPELLTEAIEKGKSGETINLSIEKLDVVSWRHLITGSNLQFVVDVKGKASIEIEHLKKGKTLKIAS